MLSFRETIAIFIQLVECTTGATPTFRINFKDERIEVLNCSGSFLRQMVMTPRSLVATHSGYTSFQIFA